MALGWLLPDSEAIFQQNPPSLQKLFPNAFIKNFDSPQKLRKKQQELWQQNFESHKKKSLMFKNCGESFCLSETFNALRTDKKSRIPVLQHRRFDTATP
jgi:hypothetical protein